MRLYIFFLRKLYVFFNYEIQNVNRKKIILYFYIFSKQISDMFLFPLYFHFITFAKCLQDLND